VGLFIVFVDQEGLQIVIQQERRQTLRWDCIDEHTPFHLVDKVLRSFLLKSFSFNTFIFTFFPFFFQKLLFDFKYIVDLCIEYSSPLAHACQDDLFVVIKGLVEHQIQPGVVHLLVAPEVGGEFLFVARLIGLVGVAVLLVVELLVRREVDSIGLLACDLNAHLGVNNRLCIFPLLHDFFFHGAPGKPLSAGYELLQTVSLGFA